VHMGFSFKYLHQMSLIHDKLIAKFLGHNYDMDNVGKDKKKTLYKFIIKFITWYYEKNKPNGKSICIVPPKGYVIKSNLFNINNAEVEKRKIE